MDVDRVDLSLADAWRSLVSAMGTTVVEPAM